MGKLNNIFFALSLGFLMTLPQQALSYVPERGNVTATLGPTLFKTNTHPASKPLESPEQVGVSLIALGDVSNVGSLEIVMNFGGKVYYRSKDNLFTGEQTNAVHITVGYRYWLNHFFSSSLGIYTSYPMGGRNIIYNEFPAGENINTTATEPNETGIDLAVQAELWSRERYAIVAEGRYSYSLTKLSNEYSDQYGGTLGLRYFIQAREKANMPSNKKSP